VSWAAGCGFGVTVEWTGFVAAFTAPPGIAELGTEPLGDEVGETGFVTTAFREPTLPMFDEFADALCGVPTVVA